MPITKSLSLRPLSDRVVVRQLEPEAISKGGIVIPDSASEKPNQGKVLAVGPGIRLKKRQGKSCGRASRRYRSIRQVRKQ